VTNKKFKKIMIIEDDPGDQKILKKAISIASNDTYETIVMDDSESALQYCFSKDRAEIGDYPDLVFLDLNMPGMGGKSFLKKLKKTKKETHIPIIIFTTSDSKNDIKSAYELGAAGYVVKPMHLKNYVESVSAIMDYWFKWCLIDR